MPIIAYNMAKMKQMVFNIKSQKWYNIFWGANEAVAHDLGAQWKIRLCVEPANCKLFSGQTKLILTILRMARLRITGKNQL